MYKRIVKKILGKNKPQKDTYKDEMVEITDVTCIDCKNTGFLTCGKCHWFGVGSYFKR
jgi:hypothetical protein